MSGVGCGVYEGRVCVWVCEGGMVVGSFIRLCRGGEHVAEISGWYV